MGDQLAHSRPHVRARSDADDERRLLLKQLLGRIGEGTVLKPSNRFLI
jgi:hypothetical protein